MAITLRSIEAVDPRTDNIVPRRRWASSVGPVTHWPQALSLDRRATNCESGIAAAFASPAAVRARRVEVSNVEGQTGAELVSARVGGGTVVVRGPSGVPVAVLDRDRRSGYLEVAIRRANHSTDTLIVGLSVPRWDVETMKEMH